MPDDARRLVLMGLLAVWALAFGLSVHALMTLGDGPAPRGGSERMTAFLGLQGAGAIPAFGAWAVGRYWPRGSELRRIAGMPLRLTLALAAVLGGLILWARLAG